MRVVEEGAHLEEEEVVARQLQRVVRLGEGKRKRKKYLWVRHLVEICLLHLCWEL